MAHSNRQQTGRIFVVTGPSGSGKATVCRRLLDSHPEATKIITCTTRTAQLREVVGMHYRFLSREEFDRRLAAGQFLEHSVYDGNLYGSLIADYDEALANSDFAVIMLDADGVAAVRRRFGDLVRVIGIVCNRNTLRRRLVARGLSEQEVERRLLTHIDEMTHALRSDILIMTEDDQIATTMRSLERFLREDN